MKIIHFLESRTPFQQVLLTFGVIAALCLIAFLVLAAPHILLGIGAGLLAFFVILAIAKIMVDTKP